MAGNRAVDILKLLRGEQSTPGLKIVKVATTEPSPITFTFEGIALALDIDIFEVPVSMYPLRKGDRFLAYPLVGNGTSQRWGIVAKITGGVAMATMQSATSLKIDGIDKVYSSGEIIVPPYIAAGDATSNGYLTAGNIRALQAGDRVSVEPTWDTSKIKYLVTQRF